MLLYVPVLVYLLASCLYQFVAKTVPDATNPFAMLTIVYSIATVGCLCLVLVTKGSETVPQAFSPMPWSVIALGVAVIGLEASMIYAYRLGWQVSVFPTVVYILAIIMLLLVGALFFGEKFTVKKILGVVLCIAGLVCVRMK